MRALVLGCCWLSLAMFCAVDGAAQLMPQQVAPPIVTAEHESWETAGDPLLYEGDVYYPTGPTVFFDGAVMARTGVYKGIPLYQDRTLEPYSIVYVPIGGNLMKPYARRRSGELASAAGSGTPSFPVEAEGHAVELPPSPEAERPAATMGTLADLARRTPPASIESIPPPPRGARDVWFEFAGARWDLAGSPIAYAADRFAPIGMYQGFVVYRDTRAPDDRIWVPVVPGGLLTPYSKR